MEAVRCETNCGSLEAKTGYVGIWASVMLRQDGGSILGRLHIGTEYAVPWSSARPLCSRGLLSRKQRKAFITGSSVRELIFLTVRTASI